ncbi:MAG: zinc ribbon domain-containing protein [Candidatus Methylomirabilales bacterium]
MPETRCKRCGAALHATLSPAHSSPDTFVVESHEKAGWREGEWWAWAKELLFHVEPPINPLAFYGRAALYLIFLLWGWQFISMEYEKVVGGYPPINQSFMHSVNLVFHEAGHVIFTPFGRFLTVLGGTLGQWLIPFIVLCTFLLKTRDTFGAAIGLWWLGQSFLDIAPYINDARAGQLILLGGVTGRDTPGYHDWENILRDLGWLQYDHTLAGIVHAVGVSLMLLSFLWGAYVLYLQYTHLDRPSS